MRYQPNQLLRAAQGVTPEQSAEIDAVLLELFGTPDEPRLPEGSDELRLLVDRQTLRQAAGPVISHTPGVTQGLYRRHCARCHGITGDGVGPTALHQAPYPRDFRRGVYKWKSTARTAAPTKEDLHRVLHDGVPGTAMPSFQLIDAEERDALVQYVIYLSIRGEAEQALIELADDEAIDFKQRLLAERLPAIVNRWALAEQNVVEAPTMVAPSPERVAIGKKLFHDADIGCVKCHGPEGKGRPPIAGGYNPDYDDWNRIRVTLAGDDRDGVQDALREDLPATTIEPRRLAGSTPHGGAEFSDLYRRIHEGIASTPMLPHGGDTPGALTEEEIISLVCYVQTLIAGPEVDQP